MCCMLLWSRISDAKEMNVQTPVLGSQFSTLAATQSQGSPLVQQSTAPLVPLDRSAFSPHPLGSCGVFGYPESHTHLPATYEQFMS